MAEEISAAANRPVPKLKPPVKNRHRRQNRRREQKSRIFRNRLRMIIRRISSRKMSLPKRKTDRLKTTL